MILAATLSFAPVYAASQGASLPYLLDFEVDAVEAAAMAEEWEVFNFDNNDFKWSVKPDGLAFNFNEYGGKAQDALMSPAFNLTPGEYDLSFRLKGGDTNYPLNIGLYSGEAPPASLSSFSASSTITLNGSEKTFEEHNLKLQVNSGGQAHIVFFTDKSKRYGYDLSDIVINRISLSGQEVELTSIPYSAADYSDFAIFNVNGDSEQDGSPTTWRPGADGLRIDSPFQGTDDWAISPAFEIVEGKVYKLSLSTEIAKKSSVEFFTGQAPAVAAMTTKLATLSEGGCREFLFMAGSESELVSSGMRSSRTGQISTLLFMPPGPISFGFHAPSSGATASVISFVLTESTLDDLERRPSNVKNLEAVVSDFEVTLKWNAPDVNNALEPLTTIDKIEVLRNGELLKTFETPAPGDKMQFSDTPARDVSLIQSFRMSET